MIHFKNKKVKYGILLCVALVLVIVFILAYRNANTRLPAPVEEYYEAGDVVENNGLEICVANLYFGNMNDIVDKKNLPAGNYEEQDSFIVGDRIYQGLADAVEPVTGITNGAEKTAQSFLVNGSLELNEDENNEGLDTAVQIMVQVDAYQTLNRPVIDTRWTRVITNYAMIIS